MVKDEVCAHGPGVVYPIVYEPTLDSDGTIPPVVVSNDRPAAGERLKTPPGVPDIIGVISEILD
jgi:hypothetical protein